MSNIELLEEKAGWEVQEWADERLAHERRNAPKERNTPAAGMTMGAIETLEALKAWLNGEEE